MIKLNPGLLKTKIEESAEYDFSNNKVFGSAYWVSQGEKTVYENCFGSTDPEGTAPVTERTLFRMASMTKPVTTLAALILIDRGLLSLSDRVVEYIPGFDGVHVVQSDGAGSFIDLGSARMPPTILHLLTHTSGIGSEPLKDARMTDADKATLDDSIRFYIRNGLDFEPGRMQMYSATGAFDVMARIIETIDGRNYQTFLEQEIFGPCGMRDTTFVPSQEQWLRMIAMHDKSDGRNVVGKTFENCVFSNYPCTHFLGGGGLASTLRDYSAFAGLLLNRGRAGKERLIREETFGLMCRPHVTESIMPGYERWGLGVRIIVDDAYPFLPCGTFGWSGAFGTHFWVDYQNEIAAVFLKNSLFDGGAANESARNFEKAVYTSI